ncbi:alpha/beta hydrolase family protein [Streptosporangium sp. NPDC087985]|uniref:alpha/beta hydrolase family protein n=1 Tax=Streptosporangium sp. NPDC087985 TaxID=3366196 RepID=UPI0038239276
MSEPAVAGLVRVSVPVICEQGALTVVMSVDGAGKLQGLRLVPAATASWKPPSYAAPKRFDEHDVTVGSAPLAVSGTLSLPRGRGPRPGVVLLSGGGLFDRDETSGPNRPLKDLAWGLASRGVAVVRFDKVTYTHGSRVADAPGFTVAEEYVPHAVAAVHLLRRQPVVDPARVFVLGDSMGGKVAPRVAAAEASVAGLVILAGEAQPMQRSAVRVARYLASLDPGPSADGAVEAITRQAALVDGPELSPSTPAGALPFGLSASYWLDLRGYDPVSTAAALGRPMLILQGGRDYQVTVADDLSRWRAGLARRPDVTIRVYDADNHLFFPGAGPSTPAEYGPARHVDPAVVADIAGWLAPGRGKIARLVSGVRRLGNG